MTASQSRRKFTKGALCRRPSPTLEELDTLFTSLMDRGIYDFEPYVLHAFGRGPDPDIEPKPRPVANLWNRENT